MKLVRQTLGLRETPSLVRLIAPDHFDRRSLVYVWATDSLASRFAPDYAASPEPLTPQARRRVPLHRDSEARA